MAAQFQGQKLMRQKEGQFVEANPAELQAKVVGVYFSAHWCGPCREFTPILKEFYKAVSSFGFEVVFLSSDESEEAMFAYMKEAHGDWLVLSFGNELIQQLKNKFDINGIPTLTILKPDGTVIEADAVETLQDRKEAPAAILKNWRVASGLGDFS